MPILLPQRLESDTGKRVFVNRVKEGLTGHWQRKDVTAEASAFFVTGAFGDYRTA
jgi:hypothetical protein